MSAPPFPSAMSIWFDRASVQQDGLWFLALLGWSLALVAWWGSPGRRAAWAWLPWAAAAGVLTALVQFFVFDPPFGFFFDRLVPGTSSIYLPAPVDPNLLADLLLAAVLAGTGAAWAWQHARARGAAALRWPAVLLLAGAVAMHLWRPAVGGWLLALLPLPAVGWFWIRPETHRWSRAALLLAALGPAASTVGPVAVELGLLQRSGPPTVLGAAAGAWQLLAGGVALLGLARDGIGALPRERRAGLLRDSRPFVLAALAVFAAGAAFALQTGRDNRREVMVNRLRLTASEARVFPAATVAELVAPDFRIDAVVPPARPGDAWLGRSAHLVRVRPRAARDALARLVATTPFLELARFVTLRDGWLVVVASSDPAGPPGSVELLRREIPQDREAWRDKEPWIEESPRREIGQPYYCRAPVAGPDGETLGWLEFVRAEFHSTTERKWRAQSLLVTALGVVLAALLFAQRRTAREREAVVRAAAVAAESSRIKTAFLAKVSHELRTPLQGILGYCELLQRDLAGETARARLAALHSHGELMTRLVNDLLDLSAIEAGAFRFVLRPVPVADLVRQTVESLRPRAAAKGLALGCTVAPDVPAWVACDAERLRQILLNLLGNALKFTAAGRVDVALSVRARPAGACELEIAVTDTGPGIAPADQPRLFQPFSRLDPAAPQEGAGLGLALAAALCRSTGGDILVESDGVRGACFRARLHLALAAAPVEPTPAAPVAGLAGRRVLVADDNVLVRELFASYLRGLGAACDAVADGEEAVARAAAGRYDAIVLDLAMPKLDGFAAARRLRAAAKPGAKPRIVGVSAHARAGDRDLALAAGMDAFLSKPVELPAFAAALIGDDQPERTAPAAALSARLAQMFRTEAERETRTLAEAVSRGDRALTASRAHWFKNSAAVVRDEALFAACAALEDAAEAGEAAAITAAWNQVRSALAVWRTDETNSPAG